MITEEKTISTHTQYFTNNRPKSSGLSLKKKHSPETIKALEKAWLEENREAIQERNSHVEKYGIFGEEYRDF